MCKSIKLLSTFIVLLGLLLVTPAPLHAQVYSGVFLDSFSQLPSFEANAGKQASLYMFFHSWNAGNLPTGTMNNIRSHGSIPVVSWSSYIPENATGTSYRNIANGSMDSYIREWAIDSKKWGHPYFLRLNWEMNGYWLPYANEATTWYVPMWKHVHDIFVQEGATNVTWVWCPNIDGFSTMPLEPLYPGNNYVDWVCMDGYNFGTTQNWSSWTSFQTLFAPTYNHLLKLAPGKPIMIAEMASAEGGGSKPQWITDMFHDLPSKFPNVKAFIWFNTNKEADWRIESSESARAAFAGGLASSYYLSNQYASLTSSSIGYLGELSNASAFAVTTTPKPTATPSVTITPIPSETPLLNETPTVEPLFEGVTLENAEASTEWKWYEFLLLAVIAVSTLFATIKTFIFSSSYTRHTKASK